MKADLYTAQVRADSGVGARAHRTAAGFVVYTSADGTDLIALIDERQHEPDLIDQIAIAAEDSAATAFAMLFTAGGELFLIASGAVTATIESISSHLTLHPGADQVLVHPVNVGIQEEAAIVRLHMNHIPGGSVAGRDLDAGGLDCAWAEVGIGGAAVGSPVRAAAVSVLPAPEVTSDLSAAAAGLDAPAPPMADDEHIDFDGPTEAPSMEDIPEKVAPPTPPAPPMPEPIAEEVELDAQPEAESVAEVEEIVLESAPEPVSEAEVEVEDVVLESAPEPEHVVEEVILQPEPVAEEGAPPPPEPAVEDFPAPPPPEPVAEDFPAPPAPEPVAAAAVVPPPPAPPAPVQAPVAAPVPAPMPAPAPEPPAQVIAGGPVMVLGIACVQGHHNHPDAVYCSQCGTKMGVHHTSVLQYGPRPPLGVLVVDDGTTYSLSEDLVIGREPTSHDDVVAGLASPMILTDDTLSLSRKHARIVLDDWTVAVQDLGSSNGSYLSRANQAETWVRIEPSSTVVLEPGDRLRVGGRIIQIELHHVR